MALSKKIIPTLQPIKAGKESLKFFYKGRKKLKSSAKIIVSCIAASVIFAAIVYAYFSLEADKPKTETVNFEIYAELESWQTLYVKCDDKLIKCEAIDGKFIASTTKIAGAVIKYCYVLGDEWGETYDDASIDSGGYRLTSQTTIKDSAWFSDDLSDRRVLQTTFNMTAAQEGDAVIVIDGREYPMTKSSTGFRFSTQLGIGKHFYRYRLISDGEITDERRENSRVAVVSRFSTEFSDEANFDTSDLPVFPRNITLKITVVGTPPRSVFVMDSITHNMNKAEFKDGAYTAQFSLEKDCIISVFFSETDDETGVKNFDAVRSINTEDYAEDMIEITVNSNK